MGPLQAHTEGQSVTWASFVSTLVNFTRKRTGLYVCKNKMEKNPTANAISGV